MVLVLHCFSLCDRCSLFFGFCVFFLLSLGVALHYIHAFRSRCFFFYSIYIKIKNKNEKKMKEGKEAHCVLALFSLFLKTRLVNLFSHVMSLVLCLALNSRCFFVLYIYIYIKGRKENEAHCVLALFSLFLKTRLVNLFSHVMSLVLCLALMSLFIALD